MGPACDVTDDPKDGSSVTCSDESLENTVFSNVLSLIISVSAQAQSYVQGAYTRTIHTHFMPQYIII